MKVRPDRISIVVTIAALASARAAFPQVDGVVPIKTMPPIAKRDLELVQEKLTPIVSAAYPKARFYRSGNTLSIWQGVSQSPPQLIQNWETYKEEKKNEDVSTSFFIYLVLHRDDNKWIDIRLAIPDVKQGMISLWPRFNLRSTKRRSNERVEFSDVARDHRAYVDTFKLASHDLMFYPRPPGDLKGARATTRYEFAVDAIRVVHPLDIPGVPLFADLGAGTNFGEKQAEFAQIVHADPAVNASIVAFITEFEPEMSEISSKIMFRPQDETPSPDLQPRFEYFSLGITSGKGVNVDFVRNVQRTLATYAAETLVTSSKIETRTKILENLPQ